MNELHENFGGSIVPFSHQAISNATNVAMDTARRQVSNTTSPRSNWEVSIFADLQQAIAKLTKLDQEDDFHLEPDAASLAIDILGVLRNCYELSPPKLLPEGNEDVSFTWDVGQIKTYLNVSPDGVEAMRLDKGTWNKSLESLSNGGSLNYVRLMEILHLIPRTETNEVG